MKTVGLTRPVKASRIFVGILALVSLFVSTLGLVSLRESVAAADDRTNMSSAIHPASVGTGILGDNSSVVNHAVPWRNRPNIAVSGGVNLYSYPMAAVGAGTYQNDNPNVTYTGTWTRVTDSQASGGNYERSNTTNSTAALTVVGAGSVKFTILTRTNGGYGAVLIDGVQQTFPLTAPGAAGCH